ncbi:Uncharacterised protein [Vibrio cholerae]|nr:Uncharacterised protein [Vibrio cholerae]
MCDAEGNTKEHVPPKCIFPEAKDVPSGDNYKKRSCSDAVWHENYESSK